MKIFAEDSRRRTRSGGRARPAIFSGAVSPELGFRRKPLTHWPQSLPQGFLIGGAVISGIGDSLFVPTGSGCVSEMSLGDPHEPR